MALVHLALVMLFTIASATSNLRAIIVPEAAGASYSLCTDSQLAGFSSVIADEAHDCGSKSAYDWNSEFLPTTTERQQLCSCTSLINKLQDTRVPHCTFYRSGAYYSYKQLAEFAFGLCTPKKTSSTTTSNTNRTGYTIGIVAGVVVVIALIVYRICCKRRGRGPHYTTEAAQRGESAVRPSQGELSSLGEDDDDVYEKMSPRKKKKKISM